MTRAGSSWSWGDATDSVLADLGVATVTVRPPKNNTLLDTPSVVNAVADLTAALSFGPATLLFPDGVYQIDSNSFVLQGLSNFAVKSAGRTHITQAPNRAALPDNTSGDLCVIADCQKFRVEDITFDCKRDTVSPLIPLTATASSGQATATIAAGSGSSLAVGQHVSVYGGQGSADSALTDGRDTTALKVLSVTSGAGAGGGDLVTFSRNLNNTYSVTGGVALSDGFGPYSWTSDYISPYEAYGISNTVAGRTSMKGEDQQNNLHLMSCSLFVISRVTAKNSWSSQIKCGGGFEPTALTDGCSQGTISNCTVYHGYDQGISLWNCTDITVSGCVSNASGWGGIVTFSSNNCTISGNSVIAPVYATPPYVGNGNGIAIQGGSRNTVVGNTVSSAMQNGVYLLNQGPGVVGEPPTGVTTTAYLPAQTAAGTSVAVSATTVGAITFAQGSQLSILDGYRTEIVYIASVVDGTHLTFSNATRFPHPSGVSIGYSVAEDTVVSGNSINNSYDNGIANQGVRALIEHNTITGSSMANSASNSGIWCSNAGYGSVIRGNQVGGGHGASITMWSVDHMVVEGNQISGPALGTAYAVDCQNFNDSVFSGNRVSDGLSSGVRLGGTSTNRSTFAGNLITRFIGDGLSFNSVGQGNTITGNTISSCYGTAGINLNGMQYSTISGNVCSGNHASGIQLNNSGSTYCLYNTISGNICRDDGSGVRIDTGAAVVQQYGIREVGNSDYNTYDHNEVDSNSSGQLVIIGAHSVARKNIISGSVIAPVPSTPAVPATTVAQQNTTGYDVIVYLTDTTVTVVDVGATNIGITTGPVYLPAGQTITLTYATGTPTWVWMAAG